MNLQTKIPILIILISVMIIPVYAADSHGMTYFPSDHVWNTPVDTLPIMSSSSTKISNVISRSIDSCDGESWCHTGNYEDNIWLYDEVPINWVNSSTEHHAITYDENGPPGGNSDWWDAPVFDGLKIQTDNPDAHCVIVDTDEERVYEFYHMHDDGGTNFSCGAEFVWNLSEYRIQPNDTVHPPYGLASVNAAGTPYFVGMAKYDEIVAGDINHAIGGVTVFLADRIVWPGSSRIEAHESGAPTNDSLPAYSDRLRLNSSYSCTWMDAAPEAICEALKEYGVITVDRGSIGYSILIEQDDRMPDLSDLHQLSLNDFEYIDESSLMINASTAQANQEEPESDGNYTYSFVHVSDYQKMTKGSTYMPQANDSFQDLEDWKSTYNISLILNTGDLTDTGYDEEFQRYLAAESLTTIPVYSIMGNHDFDGGTDGCCGNYVNWTEHMGERNYSINILPHFAIWGQSWDNGDTFPPGFETPMNNFFDANPTKIPVIFTHRFLEEDYDIDPIGYDLLDKMNHDENTLILSGHDYPSTPVHGAIIQFCDGTIDVMADLVDPQEYEHAADPRFARLYQVTVTNGEVSGFNASTIWFNEDMINETVTYDLFTNTTCGGESTPVAAFSANVTSGTEPLAVGFTDNSTNTPDDWDWYFGNGTKFSDAQSPSVTLSEGTYTINLYASNSGGGDWENKTNYITVSSDSSGNTTVTFYTNNTNWDARFTRAVTGQTWSQIRDGAGTAILNTTASINGQYLQAHTTSNQYNLHARFGWSADTSSIPDDAIIDSAKFGVYGQSDNLTGLGGMTTTITGFTPTNYAVLAASDYNKFTQDIYSDNLTYASWGITWNNYTITNTSFINKDGITSLMVRNQWDVNNAAPTWVYGTGSKLVHYETSQGSPYKPFLEVTYHVEEEATPVAAFSANVTSGNEPLAVGFTDSSTNTPDDWDWYFGNGTKFSDAQNPSVTLSEGTYTINLYASNGGGGDWENKTSYINVTEPLTLAPIADFYANYTFGLIPLPVEFYDNSSGGSPTSWYWEFGDGNTSTEQNPMHIYTDCDKSFNVSFRATNSNSSSWMNKSYYIVGDYCWEPTVIYFAEPENGTAPLSVVFTDYSTGEPDPYEYYWNFGDGNQTTTYGPGIEHTYTECNETYTVNHSATNIYGTGWSNYTDMITTDPCYPVAEFSANITEGIAPQGVQFTDLSSNDPTSWAWYISDDEIVDQTVENPVVMLYDGVYNIRLKVCNSIGCDWENKTDYITISPGVSAPVSSFTANTTNGTSPLAVGFTDTSTNTPTNWSWSFRNVTGNNTLIQFSALQNPSATFGAGNFSIKLNATNAGGSNISSQTTFVNVSAASGGSSNYTLILTGGNLTDGLLERTTDAVWSTIRTSTGTYASGTGTTLWVVAGTTSTTDVYSKISVSEFVANTSYIPDDATIISAKLSLKTNSKNNQIGSPGFIIINTTDTNSAFATSDYPLRNWGNYSDVVPYSSFSAGSFTNISFNSNGIANIDKTGKTFFVITTDWDSANNPPTFTPSKESYFSFYAADYSGTSSDPYLEIVYQT